jgi:ABC-type nitrate/sulfonate/bicarbonate transport system permease component
LTSVMTKASAGNARRSRWMPPPSKRAARRDLSTSGRADRDRKWVLLGILVVWELVMRLGLINSLFFAAPSEVAVAFVELAQDEQVRSAVRDTGVMFLAALAISTITGVIFGALLGLSNVAYRALHPLVLVFFATPSMIFIPLVILLLGTGFEAKVFYGAIAGFSPIVVTVTAGARSVDQKLRQAARSMGFSRFQTIRLVLVPGRCRRCSLPSGTGSSTACWVC